jgi:arylsulfatase A-like enzyme
LLAPLWGLRGYEAWSRLRAGAGVGAAVIVAFAWDVLLVSALIALARASAAGSTQRYARLLTAGLRVGLGALLAWDLALRAADAFYASATGGAFNATVFVYLRRSNLVLLQDGDLPWLCAAVGAGCLLIGFGLFRDARVSSAALLQARARALSIGAALLLPMLAGWNAGVASYRFVPEALFLHEWLRWRGMAIDEQATSLLLTAAMDTRLVSLGLVPAKPASPDYPLLRARVETLPFPYPLRTAVPAHPNVVLTLVEQLNFDFIHALSAELKGVMPELSELAARTTVVSEYRSITQPTIQAVVASLCSIHMAAPTQQLHTLHGSEPLENTPLRCLPDILRSHGYRTVYIQSGDSSFAGTRGFLRAHGFDEIYDRAEVHMRYPAAQEGRWGYHDDVLLQFTQQKIAELERARAAGGPPFFVMVQTIDTHWPGHAPDGCVAPAALATITDNARSQRMLKALYCSDKVLGRFAHFLLDDPARASNTLWAMSGDHPIWSGAPFLAELYARRGERYAGFAARLPLFLHDPLHELPARVPVLSGHLDLAPTLLHILGIVADQTAMTGYSIFGTRAEFPVLVGSMPGDRVAVYRPSRTESLPTRELPARCAAGEVLIADDAKALTACELLAWLQFEEVLWRRKRIVPAWLAVGSSASLSGAQRALALDAQ